MEYRRDTSPIYQNNDMNHINCQLISISSLSNDEVFIVLSHMGESFRLQNNSPWYFSSRELNSINYHVRYLSNLLDIESKDLGVVKKLLNFSSNQIQSSNKFT